MFIGPLIDYHLHLSPIVRPCFKCPYLAMLTPFLAPLFPPFPPRRVHASLFRLTDTPGGRELLRVMADPDGLPDKQGPPLHCLGAPLPSTPPMHPASRGGPSVPPRVYTQHEEVKQDDETGEPPHAIPDTCNITLDVRYRHEFMSLQVLYSYCALCVSLYLIRVTMGTGADYLYISQVHNRTSSLQRHFSCVYYFVYSFSWFQMTRCGVYIYVYVHVYVDPVNPLNPGQVHDHTLLPWCTLHSPAVNTDPVPQKTCT